MRKLLFVACLVILSMTSVIEVKAQAPEPVKVVFADKGDAVQLIAYPLEVMSIIDNRCYGCHSPQARNEKSKKAMQWILLQQMEKADLAGAIDGIVEVLEKGEMPPEKFLERFPDHKLTEEESATLKAWAEGVLNTLMNE